MATTPQEQARRIVESNSYLTLATVDEGGRPWASPVWFAARGLDDFYWVSRPEARHSTNLAANPDVALVIFDSSAPPAAASAVYVEAVASEVFGHELAAALAVYDARSQSQDLPAWREANVSSAAPHRLFHAAATQVFVLADGDTRVPVT